VLLDDVLHIFLDEFNETAEFSRSGVKYKLTPIYFIFILSAFYATVSNVWDVNDWN